MRAIMAATILYSPFLGLVLLLPLVCNSPTRFYCRSYAVADWRVGVWKCVSSLSSSADSDEVVIGDLVPTGYVFHHIPRETRGGGVGIMLKRSLDAEIYHTGTSYTSFEAIGVHLKVLSRDIYILLYTCLVVRVVHIAVAHNLDTDAFLNSFRRFVPRKESPELIRSDNSGNLYQENASLTALPKNGIREKSPISFFRETCSGHSVLHADSTMAVHGSIA